MEQKELKMNNIPESIFKNGEYSGNAYIEKSEDEIQDLTELFGIRK